MKKLLVFGASNSKTSINQQFASWTANQLTDVAVKMLDLNDYEMPIFSIEREAESGIPQLAKDIKSEINEADGIIISFAEHNGTFSTAFKNIYDWVSRLEKPIWSNKLMLALATSPGPRGGVTVLEHATTILPHRGANISGSFSLPQFSQNFSNEAGITNVELSDKFQVELNKFNAKLKQGSTEEVTA